MKGMDLSSSEFGTLWMTYQEKTMTQRIIEYFIESSQDNDATKILKKAHKKIKGFVDEIVQFFKNAESAVPVGYTPEDVNTGAPKLYDLHFDILFLRLLTEVGMGLHTLHLNMVTRKDLMNLYRNLTDFEQDIYEECMDYLEKNKVILRSPAMSPAKIVEFAKGTEYMNGGLNPFRKNRALNAVEVSHLYFAIESNSLGADLMIGFAQVANEAEVRNYFEKGKNLATKIVQQLSTVLSNSDIQVPITWSGKVTDSKVAPFSDKLMMYCTSLFCSFGLGSNALGTAFSLRKDLPLKLLMITKDVLDYGQEGASIMARNGWLEEPPQLADRRDLIH